MTDPKRAALTAMLINNRPAITDALRTAGRLKAENEGLRRRLEHFAKQPLAEQARKDHEDEGHDGEPDFEGAYDTFIEQARDTLARQALGAHRE
jgi:hypothetical protein